MEYINHFKLTPATWNNFANPISTVMATMNLTLCVFYYNWIFLIIGPRRTGDVSASGGQVKIITVKSANNTVNRTKNLT
jgi:hypothetical protein